MPLLGMDEATRSNLAKISTPHSGLNKEMKPRAILVISAHWETSSAVKVTSSPRPNMIYDYYGFPAESYKFDYPAPGDPALAKRVQSLLNGAEIDCELEYLNGDLTTECSFR